MKAPAASAALLIMPSRRTLFIAAVSVSVVACVLHAGTRVQDGPIIPENAARISAGMPFNEVMALLGEEPPVLHLRDEPFAIAVAKLDHFLDREVFWFPNCMVIDADVEKKVCADAYWEGARGYIRVGFDERGRVLRAEFRSRQTVTVIGKIQGESQYLVLGWWL